MREKEFSGVNEWDWIFCKFRNALHSRLYTIPFEKIQMRVREWKTIWVTARVGESKEKIHFHNIPISIHKCTVINHDKIPLSIFYSAERRKKMKKCFVAAEWWKKKLIICSFFSFHIQPYNDGFMHAKVALVSIFSELKIEWVTDSYIYMHILCSLLSILYLPLIHVELPRVQVECKGNKFKDFKVRELRLLG
jgi:hypothetical protein